MNAQIIPFRPRIVAETNHKELSRAEKLNLLAQHSLTLAEAYAAMARAEAAK